MPNYKSHITIGFVVLVAFWFINQFYNFFIITNLDWIIMAGIVYIFSQIPDIDSDVSKINKYVNSLAAIIIIYAFYKNKIIIGIAAAGLILYLEWAKHRGMCHSMLVGIIAAIPLYLINPLYAYVGLIAFTSHLIADGDFSWAS